MSKNMNRSELGIMELFWNGDLLEVGGRCLDQPILVGMRATQVYELEWPTGMSLHELAESPDVVRQPINVREVNATVVKISFYGRQVDVLERGYTGRVLLDTNISSLLRIDELLRFENER